MSANQIKATAILYELTRVLEIVDDRQQALDDAVEAKNNLILKAIRAGVPAEDIAEKLGVLLADVELLIGADLFRAIRYFSPSDNGRA